MSRSKQRPYFDRRLARNATNIGGASTRRGKDATGLAGFKKLIHFTRKSVRWFEPPETNVRTF